MAFKSALVFGAFVVATLLSRASYAQESALPPTTDCGFSQSDPCFARFRAALDARMREQSNERHRRGFRALGGLSLALGAPQLIGGLIAATQAQRNTTNVGHSVAWTINGVLMSSFGAVFVFLPFDRPSRGPEGGAAWIPTVVFGAASASFAAAAAGTWLAPPQDVHPTMRHLFAASMVVDALWYATLAIVPRLDLRDRTTSLSPYAMVDGRSSVVGVGGRF